MSIYVYIYLHIYISSSVASLAQVGILCLQVQGYMQCAGPPQLFAPKYLGPDSVEWPCGLAQLVKL